MNDTDVKSNQDTTSSNCLALTIRKEYRLTIATNIVNSVKRMSWKISFAILLLNFLNMFL